MSSPAPPRFRRLVRSLERTGDRFEQRRPFRGVGGMIRRRQSLLNAVPKGRPRQERHGGRRADRRHEIELESLLPVRDAGSDTSSSSIPEICEISNVR